jgi:hypothetical protein
MNIVESCLGDWRDAEKAWILGYRLSGAKLTNATDGGDGVCGYKFSDKQRCEAGDRSRARWRQPEAKERYRASMKRARANPEFREKLSIRSIAIFASQESRKAMSEKAKEIWKRPGYRERMSSSHKGIIPNDSTRKIIGAIKKAQCATPEWRAYCSRRAKKQWESGRGHSYGHKGING